jgi:anti-sigma factor RsiW
MTCELWRDQIGAYVDGELATSHDDEVSKHLKQCGDCTLYAANEIQLKRAVSTAGKRYQPSTEFRAHVLKSVGASNSRSRGVWFAFAAAAAVLVIAVALFTLRNSRPDVGREIADVHLSTIASPNPVDVASSDMHTVKPWFQGKLPFTFNVPELSGSPFTLLGGRVVYVRGTPMAQLLFQYKLHKISILIGPEQVLTGSGEVGGGFHAVSWAKNGYRYVTVGDASTEVLQDLSQRMRMVAQ